MLKKQQLKLLQEGYLKCPNCSSMLHLADFEGLEVVSCSECNTPIFIPMKIKYYWLYKPLGGGGMGSVYKAYNEKNQEFLAIKVLPREFKQNNEHKRNLLKEGEIGAVIGEAPNIVHVVDYGEEDGEAFIAFHFVSGSRLDIFVSSCGDLSEKMAIDILLQVIEAELHIVNCGFLYRDIKPENIIIVEQTATVKLLDFGLTLPLSEAANPNESDMIEGSPYYLPPERIVSAPEGEHSEVYSLGMLLFFMISGSTYFSKSDIKHIISKHVRSVRIATVSNRLKQCTPDFCGVLDKMIRRNPNERFHNLTELKNILKEIYQEAPGYSLKENRKAILTAKASSILSGGLAGKNTLTSKKDKILMFVVILCFIFIGVAAVLFMYNKYIDNQKRAFRSEIAAQFNISPNIPYPDKMKNEVEKIVKMNYLEQKREIDKQFPKFDEEKIRNEICERYGIDPKNIKNPPYSPEEFDKLIEQGMNKEFNKQFNDEVVNSTELKKQIAEKFSIELPCSPPKYTPKQLTELLKSEALRTADKKYTHEQELQKIKERLKTLKLFKTGEVISFQDKNGNEYAGLYRQLIANNILIAGNQVPLSSLSPEVRVHFDNELCEEKRNSVREDVHKDFETAKQQFIYNYINQHKKAFFKKHGFVHQRHSSNWIAEYDILTSGLQKAETQLHSAIAKKHRKKWREFSESFDKIKFIQDLGYIKHNGVWITEKEFIDNKVNIEKIEYNKKRDARFAQFAKEFKEIEKDIYFENGYLSTGEGWKPAKEVLDDEIRKIFH